MSGRHQNATWTALDPRVLAQLRDARGDRARMSALLAAVAPDAEQADDPAHCAAVWERAPDILRAQLLPRFLRTEPSRWGPLLADAIAEQGDEYAERAFREAARVFELFSVPDAYGALLYASPRFAARFGLESLTAGDDALVLAFGGEPDPAEPDLRLALRDARYDAATVARIASALAVPAALPALTPPRAVDGVELDPAHVSRVIADVVEHFQRAARRSYSVDVQWHPNP